MGEETWQQTSVLDTLGQVSRAAMWGWHNGRGTVAGTFFWAADRGEGRPMDDVVDVLEKDLRRAKARP
jgi:hypothetical protein